MKSLDLGRYALSTCVAYVMLAGCGGSQPPIGAPGVGSPSAAKVGHVLPEWQAKGLARAVCPQVVGRPTCLALTTKGIRPACVGSTCGWAPIDFQTRYGLPIAKGSGQIVAIVDAGDNPNAAGDIAEYRSEFGLVTANFYKYNQEGQQSNYPSYTGWSVEIDLDIEMVSATCPKCTIYLVEANSSDGTDLDTAEKEAVTLGAHMVSNGWICYGTINSCGLTGFDTPGVLYLGSSGNGGYDNSGPPSVFDTVVSVGGTQLSKKGEIYSETIFQDVAGGCATDVTKPSWQHDPDCTYRTYADVSAEEGCSPGVAEYDSYDGGWFGVCGDSATPLIAGVYGLASNATKQHAGKKLWTLTKSERKKYLHVISEGSDGECGGRYLCTAGTGQYKTYSGPGGWGTPFGIGAF